MIFRALDDVTLVAGQIGLGDIAEAVAAGVTMIVNNRPDGEEPGQPATAEIETAARAIGIAYRHIPFTGLPAPEQVGEMARAMDEAEGRLLAFCRSGTRSTCAWALARARQGADPEMLIGQAAAAGYDLAPLRPYLG